MKCPCDNDMPDPCPLCGATVATGVCQVSLFTKEITSAVINAVGDSEGEPIGLRAATVLAAIRRHLTAIALLAFLATVPAKADQIMGAFGPINTGNGGATTLQQDGLGPDGLAWMTAWRQGGVAVWYIYTGAHPEPYGSIVIPLSTIYYPIKTGTTHHLNAACLFSRAETSGAYVAGYNAPQWWPAGITLERIDLDNNANTVTMGWQGFIPPYTTLAGTAFCGNNSNPWVP